MKLLSMGAVALLTVSATATAAETEYSGTVCGFAKSTMLQASPDVTVFADESWGMQTPDSTFKPWANGTVHCVQYHKVLQGKETTLGSCQWTDNTGDTFIGESTQAPDALGILDLPWRHGQMEGCQWRRDVQDREPRQTRAGWGQLLLHPRREIHLAPISNRLG